MRKTLIVLSVLGAGVGCGGSTHLLEVAHYEEVCGASLCLITSENGQAVRPVERIAGYTHQWGVAEQVLVEPAAGGGLQLVEVVGRRSMVNERFTLWIDRTAVKGNASGFMLGGAQPFGCDDADLCRWIEKKLDLGEKFPVEFAHGSPLRALTVL